MVDTLRITDVAAIATQLEQGCVGVLPTDTIYGVIASARIPEAVQKLYAVKHRHNKPGTVIAANIMQLTELGIPLRYVRAVEQFWPNPISIVLPFGGHCNDLDLGSGTLACRVPSKSELQALLEKTGPLVTSSANLTGEVPAMNLAEAQAYFGNTVDFYVDGGDISDQKPSTIIRMVDDAVEVLREGAVTVTESGEIIW